MSAVLAGLARRVDLCWTRFEETGDEKWLSAACEADRMYLRAKELQS